MEISTRNRARPEGAPGRGLLSILEVVFLGIAGIFLVVLVIPQQSGVETWCFLDGPETAAADQYANTIAIVALASWVAMTAATIIAFRLRRPTLGVLLPLGWFAGLTALAAIVTSAMGPQPCQGSFW